MALQSARALPVGLLQGYDSFTGDGRATALIAQAVAKHGGESNVSYRVCEGTQELMQELGINQSLTIGLFGNVFNLSQKMEFVRRQEVTTHSVCIVVHARHTEGTETVTDAVLGSHVKPPESGAELKEFHQVYGDSYMVSRTTGGEYIGIYTFYSETAEEQHQLSLAMEVAGIYKAFAGDFGLQTKINDFRSSQNTRMSFDQLMTGKAGGLPDGNSVLDFALRFPSIPLTAPVITSINTRGYERVPGIGRRFDAIARNVQQLMQPNFVANLMSVLDVRQNVRAITAVSTNFAVPALVADEKLRELSVQVDADEKAVQAMVEAFEADPTRPLVLELSSLNHGTAMLGFVVRDVPMSYISLPIDATAHFDDVGDDVQRFLRSQTRITGFELMYASPSNELPHRVNLRVSFRDRDAGWVAQHGNAGMEGFFTEHLAVPQGGTLASFHGSVSVMGSSAFQFIRLELSNGQSIALSDGPAPEGPWFFHINLKTPDHFVLLGFRGSNATQSSPLLSQYLRLVYTCFTPIVWR